MQNTIQYVLQFAGSDVKFKLFVKRNGSATDTDYDYLCKLPIESPTLADCHFNASKDSKMVFLNFVAFFYK